MKVYRFTIPGTLPNLNDIIAANRNNRYQGAALKAKTQEGIIVCLILQLNGVKITKPVTAHFSWYEKNKRRDLDNIAAAKKFILDALVEYGTLQNDGWNNVVGFTDSFGVSPDSPRVEVELVEVEND